MRAAGDAYVRFALDEPGLFAVMFRSDLLDNDDPESLAARVYVEECEAYPEAIRLFATRRLSILGRRVFVRPED